MSDLPTLANDSGWLIIWNDIKTFGSGFWAFFILISFYVIKDQIKDLFNLMIKKMSMTKTNDLHYTKKDLIKHNIFTDLNYWLSIGIKAISFKTCGHHHDDEDYISNKEIMTKEVIRIKFETIRNALSSFVEENDIENMDSDVVAKYFHICLTKVSITERQKLIERGIPSKFLNKYATISDLAESLIRSSVQNIFSKNIQFNTATKMYIALSTLDGYLNIVFDNLIKTMESINGDLKDEMFDGKPMCKSYCPVLLPPHPSYALSVQEKLEIIAKELYASRAIVYKYFEKDGGHYHSAVYEYDINGITSEKNDIQMISDDAEKNILNIMEKSGCIAADISKFGTSTIERLNSRGVKAIVLCPIYNNGKIDGALGLDYMSNESFDIASKMDDLDDILKENSEKLAVYIEYPKGYNF